MSIPNVRASHLLHRRW